MNEKLPTGWDEARVRRVLDHYEQQTEDEAVAEDEAALSAPVETLIRVPVEILPAVRRLIAQHAGKIDPAPTREPG